MMPPQPPEPSGPPSGAKGQAFLTSRRSALLGAAVAVVAAAGGALLAHRRTALAPLPEGAVGLPDALWNTPMASVNPAAEPGLGTQAGGTVQLASLRGQPLVVNFWATWCPPCVKEMPELAAFARSHAAQGWRVVALALDREPAVAEFLDRQGVPFTVAIAPAEALRWTQALGNASGGLPFTVLVGKKGQVLHRHLGDTTANVLAGWAAQMS